jgi:hypothetical protein
LDITVNVFTLTLLKTFFPLCTRFVLVHYLTALPKYTDINVSNDLTKTERAREKELWEEAKK